MSDLDVFAQFRGWLPESPLPNLPLASHPTTASQSSPLYIDNCFRLSQGASIRGGVSEAYGALEGVTRKSHTQPLTALIEDVSLIGRGFVLVCGGRAVSESTYLSLKTIADFADVFRPGLPYAERALSDDHVWIVGSGAVSGNYWHWVSQVLPAILSSIEFSESLGLGNEWRLLVSPMHPFHRESLQLLGVDPSRIEEVHPHEVLHVPRIVYSTYLRLDWTPGVHRRTVADLLKGSLGLSEVGNDRIYVARLDSRRRVIANETEVAAHMAKRGFEVIVPGKLSFADQVRTFWRSEIVVGPHGAGLGNLLFTRPGTRVLEIGHDGYTNAANVVLGMTAGSHYWLDYFPNSNPGAPHLGSTTVDLGVLRESVGHVLEL